MEQHRMFLGTPCQLSPTIIKIGQTSFAMFRDPTNKPWQRCLCILKSSLGRVLQRFRKNGVIEGDGRGVVAGRQQPPQPTGRRSNGADSCARRQTAADGRPGRKPLPTCAPVQEAPPTARAAG
ncbi:UNVERIFIED_CONTAM: hypothetical protein Sindi_3108200 [Sesamum indicum]